MPCTDGYNIITEPVRIDFIFEDETKLSKNEKKRLSNLCNKREKGEKINRKLVFIVIEYYKPLFESLFLKNKKGEIGNNYIQVPKAFYAEIKATIARIENMEFSNGMGLKKEKFPLHESDVRVIFLYIALHDNGKADYITINALDFAESCFPGDVKIIGTDKKKYISKADGSKIRAIIKKTIIILKQMGKSGKMDGGRFIPIELDETRVQYSHKSREFRINLLRPKKTKFPTFNPSDIRL